MTTKCTGLNCTTTTGDHSPECRAEHAAAVAGGRFVKVIGDEREAFEQFLRDKKFPVLPVWKDGRPFQNYALEVMFDAWQGRAALGAASGQKLTDQAILDAWDAVQEPFGDAHIISFARALLAASEPKKD